MNIRKILFSLLAVSSGMVSFGQDKWDLRRAVEYALANNISIRQADVQRRLADLTLRQNRLSQYPSALINASSGLNFGRSIDPTTNLFTNTRLLSAQFSFQSGMNVFNFQSLRNEIEGSKFDSEAARVNIERVSNDIALNVASAYLLVLVANQQVRINEVSVQQSLQNLENTRKRVDAGALPELNLAELEAQLARDSTALISSTATVRTNILQLKALLNLDAAVPFDVTTPPLDQIPVKPLMELDPESVYTIALANLPQQKVANLRIRAAEKYQDAARGRMYPSLGMFLGAGSQYANNELVRPGAPIFTGQYQPTQAKVVVNNQDYFILSPVTEVPLTTYRNPFIPQISDNFRQNVGLQMSIPLFSNGQLRTAWQRSKLNTENLELQRDQEMLTLKQNIYTAHNDAVAAVQRFSAGKKGVETAEKAYVFAQRRYELGLLSTIDLLTNQNNLNRARVELAQAEVDYVFRLKLLEFYTGQGISLE